MNYNPEIIGKIIKKEREKLNLTQTALGKKLNIVGKQISNYEKGKTIPPIEVLFKLCDVFNCELGYLLNEEKYSQGTQSTTLICNETGLSVDTINAIRHITGTDHSCLLWRHESIKYKKILNTLLSSKEFAYLIQTLAELDSEYSQKNKENLLWNNLHDELGDHLFDFATENYDSTFDDEIDFTEEECLAIRKWNSTQNQCYEEHLRHEHEMKVHHFNAHEAFSLLLNTLYPLL